MKNKKEKNRRKKLNSIDYSYDYSIIKDYESLQTKYIKLFIDLKTHKSIVDEDFYVAARQALTQQYLDEYALLLEESRHTTSERFYLAESLNSVLNIQEIRRRRLFRRSVWENSAMKDVLDARVNREASGYIDELLEGLEPPDETEKEELTLKEEPTEPESSDAEPEQAEEPEPEDGSELDELYELEEQDETEAETAEGAKTESDGEQGGMPAIETPVQQWLPMEASEGAEPEQEKGETNDS